MRLIHGHKTVKIGTPAALTEEPLRAVRLWITLDDGAAGSAFLCGAAPADMGVEVGAGLVEFDFTAGGRGSVDASSLRVNVSSGSRTAAYTLLVA